MQCNALLYYANANMLIYYKHILCWILSAMAQPVNRMDLRPRGPGFDSGCRRNVFWLHLRFYDKKSSIFAAGFAFWLIHKSQPYFRFPALSVSVLIYLNSPSKLGWSQSWIKLYLKTKMVPKLGLGLGLGLP